MKRKNLINLDELAKENLLSKTNLDGINPKIKSDIKNKTKKLIENLKQSFHL